jgi:hypothetical protein
MRSNESNKKPRYVANNSQLIKKDNDNKEASLEVLCKRENVEVNKLISITSKMTRQRQSNQRSELRDYLYSELGKFSQENTIRNLIEYIIEISKLQVIKQEQENIEQPIDKQNFTGNNLECAKEVRPGNYSTLSTQNKKKTDDLRFKDLRNNLSITSAPMERRACQSDININEISSNSIKKSTFKEPGSINSKALKNNHNSCLPNVKSYKACFSEMTAPINDDYHLINSLKVDKDIVSKNDFKFLKSVDNSLLSKNNDIGSNKDTNSFLGKKTNRPKSKTEKNYVKELIQCAKKYPKSKEDLANFLDSKKMAEIERIYNLYLVKKSEISN